MIRLVCLAVAACMLPFALTTFNGASLIGCTAITAFIALSIRATTKENQP